MKSVWEVLLLLATLGHCSSANHDAQNFPAIPVSSEFEVQSVRSNDCGLSKKTINSMRKAGYVKVTCPFGVLIAGTARYPDNYLLYAANILASLIDGDSDGEADLPGILTSLSFRNGNSRAPWLAAGINEREEERNARRVKGLGYYYGMQTWKGLEDDNSEVMKQIITEETFHMVHGEGWAKVFPDQFGISDFNSVVCKEMARVECAKPGWYHPENRCPGAEREDGEYVFPDDHQYREPGSPLRLPLRGTCNDAECDCSEFYHQAALTLVGASPGWYSPTMPTSRAAMRRMLSTEFLRLFENPVYKQIASGSQVSGKYKSNGDGSPSPTNPPVPTPTTQPPVTAQPYFEVGALPRRFGRLTKRKWKKYVNVFGVHVFAQDKVRNDYVLHAANILAEQLDQNLDGEVDHPNIVDQIKQNGGALVITNRDCNARSANDFERYDVNGQCLGGEEIRLEADRDDATFEETHHLIWGEGIQFLYPQNFSPDSSRLTTLMDVARGGRFEEVPDKYPNNAWYTYYDETCDYNCQAGEFIWWLVSSLVGTNMSHCKQGNHVWEEFRYCTPELIKANIGNYLSILQNKRYGLPYRKPTGRYNPGDGGGGVTPTQPKCTAVKESCGQSRQLCEKYCSNEAVMNDLIAMNICRKS